ncbi:MAG TPA: histidine triad nucleotide-binding protein [Gammaproteobacteria bacterium]|nr:histidine triad nucleotide-binding protein [Gammaproteobacteria bacterium]
MSDTIFSKIIRREIPADIVYEDGEVLAFRDINPQAPTHVLIIPKKVIPTVNDLKEADAALVGKLVLTAQKIAAEQGLSEDGYRLVINCNTRAGQTVYHLHLHLLGGRQMKWPPG